MTHDELLAEIDSNIQFCTCDYRYANNCWESENVPWKALRAVVELHKPKTYLKGRIVCDCCNIGGFRTVLYPCPTIQEIQFALEQPHLNHRMA